MTKVYNSIDIAKIELYSVIRDRDGLVIREARFEVEPVVLLGEST
ncbi:MAG TPA: hypothetical protein VMB52_01205 [Verrucomicrobiae bacterium]|nr:hypothetical protein [Verrucomicrobiae bacterium]